MGSLRTRDIHSFSRNQAVLAPSIHGSPLVYFHQTLPGEYLGDSVREVSSCCYHARISRKKKNKRRDQWGRAILWTEDSRENPFLLIGEIGPPSFVPLPIFESVTTDNAPLHYQLFLWIHST